MDDICARYADPESVFENININGADPERLMLNAYKYLQYGRKELRGTWDESNDDGGNQRISGTGRGVGPKRPDGLHLRDSADRRLEGADIEYMRLIHAPH